MNITDEKEKTGLNIHVVLIKRCCDKCTGILWKYCAMWLANLICIFKKISIVSLDPGTNKHLWLTTLVQTMKRHNSPASVLRLLTSHVGEGRLNLANLFHWAQGKRPAFHRGISSPNLVMLLLATTPSSVSHNADVGGQPPFSQQEPSVREHTEKDCTRHFGRATLSVFVHTNAACDGKYPKKGFMSLYELWMRGLWIVGRWPKQPSPPIMNSTT